MDKRLIDTKSLPEDLRSMSGEELRQIADELRQELIER
jgi:ribosomal protein L29